MCNWPTQRYGNISDVQQLLDWIRPGSSSLKIAEIFTVLCGWFPAIFTIFAEKGWFLEGSSPKKSSRIQTYSIPPYPCQLGQSRIRSTALALPGALSRASSEKSIPNGPNCSIWRFPKVGGSPISYDILWSCIAYYLLCGISTPSWCSLLQTSWICIQ